MPNIFYWVYLHTSIKEGLVCIWWLASKLFYFWIGCFQHCLWHFVPLLILRLATDRIPGVSMMLILSRTRLGRCTHWNLKRFQANSVSFKLTYNGKNTSTDAPLKGCSQLSQIMMHELTFSSLGYVHTFTWVISPGRVILILSVQVQHNCPPVICISSYCVIASVSLTGWGRLFQKCWVCGKACWDQHLKHCHE